MRMRIALGLFAAVSAGCSIGIQMPPTATPPAVEALGASPSAMLPTAQSTASLVTPAPAATAEPFVPFTVTTWADNVVLRANPGYLFEKLAIMEKGTALKVLARSQGGEWLMVQTPDSRIGWVFAQLVEASGSSVNNAPVLVPSDTIVVRGRVSAQDGSPISGIQFALVQGSGPNPPRTDAMTDQSGLFYAFMPADVRGTWWVSYTAISCKSNIMDADCNWTGKPAPEGVYIDLPQGSNTILEFGWK